MVPAYLQIVLFQKYFEMKEEDLILARAIVAESESPGASPAPLRKSRVAELRDKAHQFR